MTIVRTTKLPSKGEHRFPKRSQLNAKLMLLLIAGFLLSCSANVETHPTRATWNGEVASAGSLREILHEGNTCAAAALNPMLPNPNLYALGAIAELAGEITIIRGQVYLSYAEGESDTRTELVDDSDVAAALLVSVEVNQWRTLTIDESISFENLDATIAALAGKAGVDVQQRFPFLVEGECEELRWHVIDGQRLSGEAHSHEDHLNAAVKSERQRSAATLIGFFSNKDHRIFTHRNSSTHIHCVLEGPLSSGHVDHVVIPKGARISFPVVE